jgi:hypothetical protein
VPRSGERLRQRPDRKGPCIRVAIIFRHRQARPPLRRAVVDHQPNERGIMRARQPPRGLIAAILAFCTHLGLTAPAQDAVDLDRKAMIKAIEERNLSEFQVLLKHGYIDVNDPHLPGQVGSYLWDAMRTDAYLEVHQGNLNYAFMRALLAAGADPKQAGLDGCIVDAAPTIRAADMLIAWGASVKLPCNPLGMHIGATPENVAWLQFIGSKGGDLDLSHASDDSINSRAPLIVLAHSWDPAKADISYFTLAAKVLIAAGDNLNRPVTPRGVSEFTYIITHFNIDNMDITKAMVEDLGVQMNVVDRAGFTALDYMTMYSCWSIDYTLPRVKKLYGDDWNSNNLKNHLLLEKAVAAYMESKGAVRSRGKIADVLNGNFDGAQYSDRMNAGDCDMENWLLPSSANMRGETCTQPIPGGGPIQPVLTCFPTRGGGSH